MKLAIGFSLWHIAMLIGSQWFNYHYRVLNKLHVVHDIKDSFIKRPPRWSDTLHGIALQKSHKKGGHAGSYCLTDNPLHLEAVYCTAANTVVTKLFFNELRSCFSRQNSDFIPNIPIELPILVCMFTVAYQVAPSILYMLTPPHLTFSLSIDLSIFSHIARLMK